MRKLKDSVTDQEVQEILLMMETLICSAYRAMLRGHFNEARTHLLHVIGDERADALQKEVNKEGW
jgi:hypothetical protein